MARGKKTKKAAGPLKKWIFRLIKAGLFVSLMAVVALVIAVYVARSSLPGYEDLK